MKSAGGSGSSIGLLVQEYGETHYLHSFVDELFALGVQVRNFGAHEVALQVSARDFGDVDALVVFLQYPRLLASPPIDWSGFTGKKVLLDFDLSQNYSTISSQHRLGTFLNDVRKHNFSDVLASSRAVRDALRPWFDAHWLPTATDVQFFSGPSTPRQGQLLHCGTRYPARRQAISLAGCSRKVDHRVVPRENLPNLLGSFSAALVCDMQAKPLIRVPNSLFRRLPAAAYRYQAGIEPMMKQYEYAAAGCLLVADAQPDRTFLGFVDGLNCLTYRRMSDLQGVVASLPDEDVRMQMTTRARALVETRHTWRRRAESLVAHLTGAKPSDDAVAGAHL